MEIKNSNCKLGNDWIPSAVFGSNHPSPTHLPQMCKMLFCFSLEKQMLSQKWVHIAQGEVNDTRNSTV